MTTESVILLRFSEICFHLLATVVPASEKDAALDVEADRQVVATILRGDRNAFSELVGRYQSTIARQMTRFSRDPRIIEELTHDVFVQAFLSLKSYRGAAPFIHWLRKIAVRVGYRFWKKRTKESGSTVSLSDCILEIEALKRDREIDTIRARNLLGDLFQFLSPRSRLVLTLQYWDGYSVSEIAHLTGWSASMVKVQAYRARKKLRNLIEENEK